MIDRRTFFAFFAIPRVIVLEAIAAPRMPDFKLVLAPGVRAPLFEFRTYASPPPLDLFEKAGIRAIRRSNDTYMIPFRSLTERQRAWDALAADPEWRKLPKEPRLTHISIYRSLS